MATYIYRNIFDGSAGAPLAPPPVSESYAPTQWATRHLYSTWAEIWEEQGRPPTANDLDLMRLYRVAARMMVQDVLHRRGYTYVTRFWGTELAQVFGFEATGKNFAELVRPDTRRCLMPQLDSVVKIGGPSVHREYLQSLRANTGASFEVLHVPLADRSEREVARIVSVFDFGDRV